MDRRDALKTLAGAIAGTPLMAIQPRLRPGIVRYTPLTRQQIQDLEVHTTRMKEYLFYVMRTIAQRAKSVIPVHNPPGCHRIDDLTSQP